MIGLVNEDNVAKKKENMMKQIFKSLFLVLAVIFMASSCATITRMDYMHNYLTDEKMYLDMFVTDTLKIVEEYGYENLEDKITIVDSRDEFRMKVISEKFIYEYVRGSHFLVFDYCLNEAGDVVEGKEVFVLLNRDEKSKEILDRFQEYINSDSVIW